MTDVVLLGHGSRDTRAAAAMREFAVSLQDGTTGLRVAIAFLDHNEPTLQSAVVGFGPGRDPIVVVPMLLSTAFHAKADVPAAVQAVRTSRPIITTAPVGSSRALASAVAQGTTGPLVIAFSGTSDPAARADLEGMALEIAAERGSAVSIGYVTQAAPTVAEAIAGIDAQGVLSYTLFPGMFSDRIAASAADAGIPATPPLYRHPALLAAVSTVIEAAAV